jgi:hypothetical protein
MSEPCSICGDPASQFTENPYALEVWGDDVLDWYCEKCLDEFAGDI